MDHMALWRWLVRYYFGVSVMEQQKYNRVAYGAAEQPAAGEHEDLGLSFSPLYGRERYK
jgi:hypothetical protein